MLETKLNKLDIEFMKVWAEYMITRNPEDVEQRIKNFIQQQTLDFLLSFFTKN